MTTPLRLKILHSLQIFFMDDRTFMAVLRCVPVFAYRFTLPALLRKVTLPRLRS